jgi:PBP1b-binding outer membrane lipoprotein LpoB
MKKYFIISILLAAAIFVSSCSEDEGKDLVNEVNKNGSIETSVSVNHLDSTHDLLVTKHIVWTNGSTSKTIINNDTIPALGSAMVEAEDEKGEAKNAMAKKGYEIFITVK